MGAGPRPPPLFFWCGVGVVRALVAAPGGGGCPCGRACRGLLEGSQVGGVPPPGAGWAAPVPFPVAGRRGRWGPGARQCPRAPWVPRGPPLVGVVAAGSPIVGAGVRSSGSVVPLGPRPRGMARAAPCSAPPPVERVVPAAGGGERGCSVRVRTGWGRGWSGGAGWFVRPGARSGPLFSRQAGGCGIVLVVPALMVAGGPGSIPGRGACGGPKESGCAADGKGDVACARIVMSTA